MPEKPKTPGKMRKFTEDRARYRQEALERIGDLSEEDLIGMFGMLSGELVARRRESELDIMRCERFHTDDLENITRHKEQLASYTRRLQACSSIVRLFKVYGAGPALKAALDAWADSTTAAISFPER